MRQIEATLEIDATPEEVWAVLMDFPSYPVWNPMIVSISGTACTGEQLSVTIAMKGGRRMRFTPRVAECEPGRAFGWLGTLGVRGLFDGHHRFQLRPSGSGMTLVHGESFRGALVLFLGSVLRDTHESLAAMNEALAAEVARRRSSAYRAPQLAAATLA